MNEIKKIKNLLFGFLLIVNISTGAYAQDFDTGLGIKVNLTEDWKQYPQENLILYGKKNSINKSQLYYLTSEKESSFVNNIYMIEIDSSNLSSSLKNNEIKDLKKYCKNWQKQVLNSINTANAKKIIKEKKQKKKQAEITKLETEKAKNSSIKETVKKEALKPIDVKNFKFDKCEIRTNQEKSLKSIFFSYALNKHIGQSQYLIPLKKTDILITATYSLDKKTSILKELKNLIKSAKPLSSVSK